MPSKPLPKTYKGYLTKELIELMDLLAMPGTGEGGIYTPEELEIRRSIPREKWHAAYQLDWEYLITDMVREGDKIFRESMAALERENAAKAKRLAEAEAARKEADTAYWRERAVKKARKIESEVPQRG